MKEIILYSNGSSINDFSNYFEKMNTSIGKGLNYDTDIILQMTYNLLFTGRCKIVVPDVLYDNVVDHLKMGGLLFG
jgi:hypothetical protein